jgi:hypothetical protein
MRTQYNRNSTASLLRFFHFTLRPSIGLAYLQNREEEASMTFRRVFARLFFATACFIIAALPALAGDDWRPVNPAQLALKVPVVDKDADAEAIFWDVQVDLSPGKTVFANYVRVKIFTERGKELRSKIELRYYYKNKIEDIAGRTIKVDGTIVELKKEAIFDTTLVKLKGVKINAKTFAMPAVEPGAIIEYRWREVRQDSSGYFARLGFQREIPIQLIKYTLKPRLSSSSSFHTRPFNMRNIAAVMEKDKSFSYAMTNVPAFEEEPHMPPEDQVRPWMLAYYGPPVSLVGFDLNKEAYDDYKSRTKVNDDVKGAALAAIGSASTPDEKLERIFQFCRTKIKNINDVASGLIADDRAKLKENKTAAETLKRGIGTGEDIDLLFAALATAAGFEARIAHVADRSDIIFNPEAFEFVLNLYFMRSYNIAVRVGNAWRFFDPASTYIPFGMLRWQEEGVKAMIVDPVLPTFAVTQLSPAERSSQTRTANLHLSEDGTLEGDVRMEYTGHSAVEMREQNSDESVEQREKNLRDIIKEKMSTAELSAIRIENAADPAKPFVYSFHVRVSGYAQRTGKRLFLQPAFFERAAATPFSAKERKHPIYFHYRFIESDTVTIQLPAGFALDHADEPAPINAVGIAKYAVKIFALGKGEALQLKRTFSIEKLVFPVEGYAALRQVFDALHQADNHTITLKQEAAKQ